MINYGFLDPKIEGKNHIFGGSRLAMQEIINLSGDWRSFKLAEESQFNRFIDSFGCTLFGTLNCLESLALKLYGLLWNKSERFVGSFANMKPQGNDPHTVAETIRKVGLVDENLMPMLGTLKTFEELWNRQEAEKYKDYGSSFLKQRVPRHDYVYGGLAMQKEALKYSPLGIDVHAWVQDENGLYYRPQGARSNHWTELLFIQDQGYEKENYMEVFDSYPPYIKKLRIDYPFYFVKRYWFEKPKSFWRKLFSFFR